MAERKKSTIGGVSKAVPVSPPPRIPPERLAKFISADAAVHTDGQLIIPQHIETFSPFGTTHVVVTLTSGRTFYVALSMPEVDALIKSWYTRVPVQVSE